MTGNLLSGPRLALANLIASSANFQTLTNTLSAGAALGFIYWPEADDDQPEAGCNFADPLPRAIIRLAAGSKTWRKGPGTWDDMAVLDFAIQAIPAPEIVEGGLKIEEAWFLGVVEQILLDMRTNSGSSDGNGNAYLNATDFMILQEPMPSDPAEFGGLHFWGVDIRVETPS